MAFKQARYGTPLWVMKSGRVQTPFPQLRRFPLPDPTSNASPFACLSAMASGPKLCQLCVSRAAGPTPTPFPRVCRPSR